MLNLDVPGLDPAPRAPVETRPKPLEAWLGRLPADDPHEAARQLSTALAAMNRTALDATTRYRSLVLLHPAVARVAGGLEALLADAGIPPTRDDWETGTQLRELWTELGYGYKRVLLALIERRSGLRGRQRLVDVTALLLLALRELQFACHQTYTPLPRGLWRETHHLYLFAREAGFADLPAAGNGASPSLIYRQALLLGLADPQRLERGALLQTRRLVEQLGALTQLSGRPDAAQAMRFFILAGADRATSQPLAGELAGALWLHTDRLCERLQEAESRLAADEPVAVPGLAQGLQGEAGLALVRRLRRSWQGKPPRAFQRRLPAASTLRLVAGVNAVHRLLLAEGLAPTEPAPPASAGESAAAASPASRPGVWQLVNDSAGGLAIVGSPDAPHSLGVGEPLALQEQANGNWSLGVIRWVRMRDRRQVEMGVERLSPQIEPVWIRPVRSPQFARPEPALLLRGVPAQQRRDCLLLPRHLYRSARDVELLHAQQLDCIAFGQRVEQGPGYDLVEFSRVQ